MVKSEPIAQGERITGQPALIHSVILQSEFEEGDFSFAPKQVQIEVGMSQDSFHYASPIFNFDETGAEEQEFIILPDLVVGTHIKVNLFGKIKPYPQD